jgi:hypothetical protein
MKFCSKSNLSKLAPNFLSLLETNEALQFDALELATLILPRLMELQNHKENIVEPGEFKSFIDIFHSSFGI